MELSEQQSRNLVICDLSLVILKITKASCDLPHAGLEGAMLESSVRLNRKRAAYQVEMVVTKQTDSIMEICHHVVLLMVSEARCVDAVQLQRYGETPSTRRTGSVVGRCCRRNPFEMPEPVRRTG